MALQEKARDKMPDSYQQLGSLINQEKGKYSVFAFFLKNQNSINYHQDSLGFVKDWDLHHAEL